MGKTSNTRKHPDGSGRRPDLSKMKREEALERQAAWANLSPTEKLAALDLRLGKGVGATSQRQRIANQLSSNSVNVEVAKILEDSAMSDEDEFDGKKKLKAKDRRKAEKNNSQ